MSSDLLNLEKPIVELEKKIEELKQFSIDKEIDLSTEIELLEQKRINLEKDTYSNLSPWQHIQIARHFKRPSFYEYVDHIFEGFIELHGDRLFRDDPSIVGGIAYLNQQSVTVIGHQKGKDTKENIKRNFGMPNPEGYRKALRLMKQASKFNRPIITFIDTPGAFPGIEAEERGQGEAIARNLLEMAQLEVPIISVIIGEGGSGGALAIAMGNHVLMLEHAIYSVISPESCGAILWKDSSKGEKAAEALKITAKDLLNLGVIDDIITEPLGGGHHNPEQLMGSVKKALISHLDVLKEYSKEKIVEHRYNKFRKMGLF